MGILATYATRGEIKDELISVELCERFGWTYKELQENPLWFINLIIEKTKIDQTQKKHAR